MGEILIWLILLVTIPRWAATLAQVDKYTAFGIPVTAIGEGIVLELGCWFIVQVYSDARRWALKYRSDWEAHDERMREQGKHNWKPKGDPRLVGYKVLMVAFVCLLLLTLCAQTPFIMAQFLPGETMGTLLPRRVLWGYSLVLVVSPEAITAAVALALHYQRVVRRIAAEEGEGETSLQFSRALGLRYEAWLASLQRVPPQQPRQKRRKEPALRQAAGTTLTKRHFDEWVASRNGGGGALTRKDALAWARDAGVDISAATGKRDRDKVLRWWRGYVRRLRETQRAAQPRQREQER